MQTQSRQLLAEPYLTVGQAARQLSLHPSTIRRWIDRGRLPAYRVGEKRIGLRASDLARLITPHPAQAVGRQRSPQPEPPVIPRLTAEQRRRGLEALAELERLSATMAARHGKLARESWEILNESRDERTRDLLAAIEG